MSIVNMFEAKSNLSRLVEAVESGAEKEIIIARNGKPAAKLTPIMQAPIGKRLGVAKGAFKVPASIDLDNETVAQMLLGQKK